MKNKHKSFFKNSSKRPSSLLKYKNPPSIKSNNKLYKSKFNSREKEIECSLNNLKNSKNKINNKNIQNQKFSYFNFLSPIFNIKKRKEMNNKNKTTKNNLILTSLNNISGINIPKKEEKILPYEYNRKNNISNIETANQKARKKIKKNKNFFMNNISLANFLSLKKSKKNNSKKKKNNKTLDNNNIISKLNSEKRNDKRRKN